ncbi:hypothetical protein [Aquimarina pacifica]|uniref:hypothetical protein n=1 Tax=Aquimarina pacifica TaxID=1296415 RepID=UPI0004BC7289|nr:hypothetical protein [Aquimarina pacifica]
MKNTLKFLMFAIGMAALIISCSNEQDDLEYTDAHINNLSGEELFKSIIFADGEITSKIPALTSNLDFESFFNDEELVAYRETQDKILSRIQEKDPNFLSSFKEAIISKEFYLIKKSILEATDLLVKTSNEINNISIADGEKIAQSIINNKELDITKFDAEGRKIINMKLDELSKTNLNEDNKFVLVIGFGIAVVTAAVIGNVAYVVNAYSFGNVTQTVNWQLPEAYPDQDLGDDMVLDEVTTSLIQLTN